jgi:hypothetical protein
MIIAAPFSMNHYVASGGGGPAFDITYQTSETDYSNTTVSYTSAASVTVPETGDYLVFASGVSYKSISSNGNEIRVRIARNSTALAESNVFNVNQQRVPIGFIAGLSLTENDTISVQGRCDAAWGDPCAIPAGATVAIIPLPSGSQVASSTTEVTYSTDTDWQNFASVTITPGATGDYLVAGSLMVKSNNSTNNVSWRIYNETDDVAYGLFQLAASWAPGRFYVPEAIFARASLTAAAKTFRLQYRTAGTGTTVSADDGYLVVAPMAGFSNVRYNSSASGSGGSNDNWITAVSDTWTPAASTDYLQLFGVSHGMSTGADWDYAHYRMRRGSTDLYTNDTLPLQAGDAHVRYRPVLGISAGTFGASERTDQIDVRRTSGGVAGYIDATILSFSG